MSTVAATIQRAHAALSQPARRRQPLAPSQRNQDIFKQVTVDCRRQTEVAAELGLSPSRICKIVHRVRRWLAAGRVGDPNLLSALEQRRLERSLAKSRHEAVFQRSIRNFDRQEASPTQVVVRTEAKPGDSSAERVPVGREANHSLATHHNEPGLPSRHPQPPVDSRPPTPSPPPKSPSS